jgi:hypothetical protein
VGRGGILCRDNLVFLFVGLFKVGLGILMWLVSGFSCGYGVCIAVFVEVLKGF